MMRRDSGNLTSGGGIDNLAVCENGHARYVSDAFGMRCLHCPSKPRLVSAGTDITVQCNHRGGCDTMIDVHADFEVVTQKRQFRCTDHDREK